MLFFVLAAIIFCGCSLEDKRSMNSGNIVDINDDEYIPDPDDFIPVDQFPELIYEEIPEYPRLAYEGGFEAYVIIQAYVGEQGLVKKAQAIKCDRPYMGFEEAAVIAAYKCVYIPAFYNGQPIGIWIQYKVEFTID
jgi:TonB family protein